VQALGEEDVGGDSGLHHLLRYSSGALESGGHVLLGRCGTRTKWLVEGCGREAGFSAARLTIGL
jgi:hypothetical protein